MSAAGPISLTSSAIVICCRPWALLDGSGYGWTGPQQSRQMLRLFYYSYLSREARQTNQESKGTAGVALAAVPGPSDGEPARP